MLTINNTLDGYLKNVEIKGNTVQGTDLADIRSVGDKVEGQELYEIPLLCTNENLNCSDLKQGSLDATTGQVLTDNTKTITDFIRIEGSGNSILCDTTCNLFLYDVNKNFIQGTIYVPNVKVFDLNDKVKYIKVRIDSSNINAKLTITKSTSILTTHLDAQKDELTILSPVQLEKVGNVADRIVEASDKIWDVEKNNIDIPLWDLNWTIGATYENTIRFSALDNVGVKQQSGLVDVISNFIIGKSSNYATSDEESITTRTSGGLNINILKTRVSTVQQLKDLLKSSNAYAKVASINPTFIQLPHSQQVKLRTFATKTNISSPTKNGVEPKVKGQVAKSKDAVINTHTEQIDNIYDELERVKKLEESTVSVVKNNGKDFVSVEATNQGYFEDVVVQGRTEVNICNNSSAFNIISGTVYKTMRTDKNLEKGKTYTFIISNVPSNASSMFLGNNTAGDIKLIDWTSNIVLNKFNYAKDDMLSSLVVQFKGSNLTVADFTNTKCMLLEGDHTQNPPSYFEGLASVGEGTDEIVVSTCNENMYVPDKIITDTSHRYTITDDTVEGIFVNDTDWMVFTSPLFANAKRGDKLKIEYKQNTTSSTSGKIEIYDINNKLNSMQSIEVSNGFNGVVSKEIVLTSDVNRVAICLRSGANNTGKLAKFSDIYVGVSDRSTFVPHKADEKRILRYNTETQTWEKPILREWDIVEKRDGKYWNRERSRQVVLNGSENWTFHSELGNSKEFYRCILNVDDLHIVLQNSSNLYLICDKFKNQVDGFAGECISLRIDPNRKAIYLTIAKSKLPTQDVAGFKAWLQANPVTVVYQLAQEKVYECTNIDLITYPSETNLTVKSGVLVPNITAKYHGTIANIVNLLQKKVSILETNMSKYAITQNRLMLTSRYNADSATFKIDYASVQSSKAQAEVDEDLFALLQDNVWVGKDNYDYNKMIEMMDFYAINGFITWEMWDELWIEMELQHNPPIETPEETPVI